MLLVVARYAFVFVVKHLDLAGSIDEKVKCQFDLSKCRRSQFNHF